MGRITKKNANFFPIKGLSLSIPLLLTIYLFVVLVFLTLAYETLLLLPESFYIAS